MTHVLLVDDEPVLLELEQKILEKKYGFTVNSAISGHEALQILQGVTFDAIVSDYAMPEMDGIALLKIIREKYNQIPFILFSARQREEVAIEALNNGATFFVQKEKNPSVAFAELAHKIHKAVDLARAERNLLIQRDLAINCSASHSEKELGSYCLDAACAVSQMDSGAIYLTNSPDIRLVQTIGVSGHYADGRIQAEIMPHVRAVLEGSNEEYRDYATLQDTSPELAECENIRSDLFISITHHKEKLGILHITSHVFDRELPDSFRRFLADIVLQISSHINDSLVENAFRESERKMATLIKNLPGMVYKSEFDNERTMEVVSEGSRILTGYPPEALIHNTMRSYASLINPDDRLQTEQIIRKAVEKHAQFRLNYRIMHPFNREKWVWEQGVGVYDENGEVIGLEGFVIDITRQKILDDQVKISQHRMNMLFSHMNSGCAIFRESAKENELVLIEMNDAAESIEGRAKEDLIGKSFSEIFSSPADAPLRDALSGLLKDGKPRTLQKVPYMVQGKQTWRDAYLYSTRIRGVQEIFLIYTDVTSRVLDEQQIMQNLREKEILLKEVHHRVKNNLQIISGILKLQAYRTDDPITQEIIQECRNQVFSMASIHEQLYNSKDMGNILFSTYIDNMVHNLKLEYGSVTERINFIVQVDPSIILDIQRSIPCGLILNELITNAVKYAFKPGSPGTIAVSMRKERDKIILQVKDNGAGLPADFETKRKSSMGMELIYRLTHQLKGEITISGEKGTDVTVRFNEDAHIQPKEERG